MYCWIDIGFWNCTILQPASPNTLLCIYLKV
jgi:hypothetical protein